MANSTTSTFTKTIAFLIGDISHEGFQEPEWLGIVEAAEERGIRLVTINGDMLAPAEKPNVANRIYRRIGTQEIDGVILADEVGVAIGTEGTRRFMESLAPIPVVSLHTVYQGFPAVVPANEREAMKLVVDHLCREHHFTRIGYIRYPESHPSAKLRYEGFVEGLRANKIAVSDEFFSPLPHDWGAQNSGITSLAEHYLRSKGRNLQAVVACDDWGAFWAADILRSMGLRVPQDIAVAGFSDYPASRNQVPALTTVSIPYAELGRQAVYQLEKMMRGERVQNTMEIPCKLAVRETCGCLQSQVLRADLGRVFPGISALFPARPRLVNRLRSHFDNTLADVRVACGREIAPTVLEALLEAWRGDLGGGSRFLHALQADTTLTTEARHLVVSAFEKDSLNASSLRPGLRRRIESMSAQARVVVGELSRRKQAREADTEKSVNNGLNAITQDLVTAFDREAILGVIAQKVPATLGIREVHLVLGEADGAPRVALSVVEGQALGASQASVPSGRLLPDELWRRVRAHSLVVKPLVHKDAELGYVILESSVRQGRAYDTLKRQLSSALEGASLVSALGAQSSLLSQSVATVSGSEQKIYAAISLIGERMEQQVLAVEGEAAAIEEMVHNIDTMATMSRRSHEFADVLRDELAGGMGAVRESMQSIRKLSESSREITNFLALISDVAEKTSLLAMNAAIQAAHAGEAGKGFSVVAEEIRKLAEGTRQNIVNIETVLKQILSNIDKSAGLSEQVGKNIEDIITKTQASADIADQLNAAMVEQDRGAQDLLKANQEIVTITNDVRGAMAGQRSALEGITKTLEEITAQLGQQESSRTA